MARFILPWLYPTLNKLGEYAKRIEDMEIHVGRADFEYTPVRKLEAKCKATMAFSPAPAVEEMNGKLRSMAATVGANAVVDGRSEPSATETSDAAPAVSSPTPAAVLRDEPMRETNNPQMWLIIGAVVFVVLTLIGMAGA